MKYLKANWGVLSFCVCAAVGKAYGRLLGSRYACGAEGSAAD